MSNKTIVQIGSKTWECALYSTPPGHAIDLSAIYTVPLQAFPNYQGLMIDVTYDQTMYGSIDLSFFSANFDIIWLRGSGYVSGVSPYIKTNGVSFTGTYRYQLIVNAGESSGVSVGNTAVITPETRIWSVGTTLTWTFRGHNYSYLIQSYSVPGGVNYTGTLSTDGGAGIADVTLPQSALVVMGAVVSAPIGGIDLNSIVNLVLVMMMMGVMVKVIK